MICHSLFAVFGLALSGDTTLVGDGEGLAVKSNLQRLRKLLLQIIPYFQGRDASHFRINLIADQRGQLALIRRSSAIHRVPGSFPPEVGKTYRNCKITGVADYGVFVGVTPGYSILLHLSRIANEHLDSIEQAGLKQGDLVDVKVERLDSEGRFHLSRLGVHGKNWPAVGKTYRDCKVTAIKDYGVFVEVTPGHRALLHISRLTGEHVSSIEEAGFKEGDLIDVHVERQDSKGNLVLSRLRGSPPEVGKTYRDCTITAVTDFGVFVEVTPGYRELLSLTSVVGFKEGDLIDVRVERQDSKGNLRLSRLGAVELSSPPEVGKEYRDCKIVAIKEYGIFVEVCPGHRALLHISQISADGLKSIEEAGFKEGDLIDVRVENQNRQGDFSLSRLGGVGPVLPAVGQTYRNCKIAEIKKFGVFVELTPGIRALLHISEIQGKRLESIEDAGFKIGDSIDVKVKERDANGKFRIILLEAVAPGSPLEVGKSYYDCKIMAIHDYGMFVEVTPGHSALLHISRIATKNLESIEEAGFKEGDLIDVQVERQDSNGNFRLSLLGSTLPQVGETYRDCKITGITNFGIFVEVTPGHSVLLHISKLAGGRLKSIEEAGLKVGDLVDVKVESKDSNGNFHLSRLGLGSSPPEIGETYRDCKITAIMDHGVLVEVTPGHEALLHISRISHDRLESIGEAGFKEGDLIDVQVERQDINGNFLLSLLGSNLPQVGKSYRDCKITNVTSYGVFAEVTPGHRALLHISQLADEPLASTEEAGLKVGDLVDVRVESRDTKGHFRLSRLGVLGKNTPKVGCTYRHCKILSITDYGLFVEVTPGHSALLHNSRIARRHSESIEEIGFKEGDLIDIQVESEDSNGNFRLSLLGRLGLPPPEVGKTYCNCKITDVRDFGVFVELTPGYVSLLHISGIAGARLESIDEAALKKGDVVDVKVEGRDAKGNLRLRRLGVLGPISPPEIGKVYRDCKIMEIKDYGMVVEVTPRHRALLQNSRVADESLGSKEAGFKEGDLIDVLVESQDSNGHLRLSLLGRLGLPPPEVGKTYCDCKITDVRDFGVFVELTPGYVYLLHISQITDEPLQSIEEANFKEGDLVDVKVEGRDAKGNLRLKRLGVLGRSPPEVGKVYYDCKITSIIDYGMFVEVTPGHQALLHISKISSEHVESIEEAGFKEGDLIDVRVERQDSRGHLRLGLLADGPPLPEVGKIYRDCPIMAIKDSGVLVKVAPRHTSWLHISKLTDEPLESMEEAGFKVGDLIDVKVDARNSKGKFQISRLGVPVSAPPEVGKAYRDCKITEITNFGIFVEVTPGHSVLLHISRISDNRLESIEEAGFKEGDLIDVQVERQDSNGNFRLSLLGSTLPQVGETYRDCKITGITNFGIFVEVTPGHTVLLHISKISSARLESIEEAGLKVGDLVDVKVESKDSNGNFHLSRLGLGSSPPEIGETYRDCKITAIMDHGVLVEVTPGHEALLHISRISHDRLESIDEAGFKEGDLIDVRVERQDKMGEFHLSRLGLVGKEEIDAGVGQQSSAREIGATFGT